MARLIIRPVEEKDIPGMQKLASDRYGAGTFPFTFYYYARTFWPDGYVVACDEDAESKIIGFYVAGISQIDRTVAWGLGMSVDAEYEETGIRAQMIARVRDQLAAAGVKTFRFFVPMDDHLRNIVANLGFNSIETYPNKMGPGEDRCLMECSLA